jgi:hypothetical protein
MTVTNMGTFNHRTTGQKCRHGNGGSFDTTEGIACVACLCPFETDKGYGCWIVLVSRLSVSYTWWSVPTELPYRRPPCSPEDAFNIQNIFVIFSLFQFTHWLSLSPSECGTRTYSLVWSDCMYFNYCVVSGNIYTSTAHKMYFQKLCNMKLEYWFWKLWTGCKCNALQKTLSGEV